MRGRLKRNQEIHRRQKLELLLERFLDFELSFMAFLLCISYIGQMTDLVMLLMPLI